MSQATYANTPAGTFNRATGFTVTNSTAAKVLVETQPAATATSTLPAYYGGCAILAGEASSTDSADKNLILYEGEVLTTQETTNTGTMATTASGSGTITRASGSFISDGWKVGDQAMIFAPDNAAQVTTSIDGLVSTIIAPLAAGTLTVNGTPFGAGTLTAGSRVVRVGQICWVPVPLTAGHTTSIANATLVNNTNDTSVLRAQKFLGPTGMLIGGMAAAISALPARVSVSVKYARY